MFQNSPQSSSPPTSPALPREEYGQGWRWLTVIASLALAASFFMPFSQGSYIPKVVGMTASSVTYGGPESDAVKKQKSQWGMWCHLLDRFKTTPRDWWQPYYGPLMGCLIQSAVPYLWGLAMAVYSLSHLLGCGRCRRIVGSLALPTSVLLGILIIALLTATLWPMIKAAPPGSSTIIAVTLLQVGIFVVPFLLIPMLHAILATRHRHWTYLYHGFVAAFLLVCPIGLSAALEGRMRHPELYGVQILIIASCLLLLARIGEARAVSRLSWFRTMLGLFLLRLHRYALPPGHCPACGYNLHALTEPRCPECGRPFAPAEAGLPPASTIEQQANCQ